MIQKGFIKSRNKKILLSHWQRKIDPKEIFLSPTFAYDTINHSLDFAGHIAGVHMQAIESYLSAKKAPFKAMFGCRILKYSKVIKNKLIWRDRYDDNIFFYIFIFFHHMSILFNYDHNNFVWFIKKSFHKCTWYQNNYFCKICFKINVL